MSPLRTAVIVAVGCAIGCEPEKPEGAQQIEAIRNRFAELGEQAKLAEEARVKRIKELKKDPQPVVDFALETVKERLVEQIGEDNLAASKVEVDPSSLKTFGIEKWTVRGSFDGKDKNGESQKTTWQVTVILFDNDADLFAEKVDLDVRE